MKKDKNKVKKKFILPETGDFYKANLHCHTVLSDGTLTPEQMKEAYLKEGYSIVAFTDHNRYVNHKELSDSGFLSLAAFEANIDEKTKKPWPFVKTWHFNFYDCNPLEDQEKKKHLAAPEIQYKDADAINAYLHKMHKKGFLSCYNHPGWSMQSYEDYKKLKGLWGIEIYNYGCELDGMYGFNPHAYDELVRDGQKLACVSADDNHNRKPMDHPLSDSFGGYVMIKAPELTYAAVIKALKNHEFYWSMGPEIRAAYIKKGKLYVETSPVQKVYVIQQGRDCYMSVAGENETLTHAEFDLTGNEGCIRIQIRDSRGLYAGTNAVFL